MLGRQAPLHVLQQIVFRDAAHGSRPRSLWMRRAATLAERPLPGSFAMRDRNSLSRVVPAPVQGVDEAARAAAPLNDALRALHAAGREAWPDVPLDAEAFAADVTNRVDAHRNLDDAVSTLHAADLFLACACSRGIASALAAFDRVHLARVPDFVRRIDSS